MRKPAPDFGALHRNFMVNSKLVVEKKKGVLLDWRGNEKKKKKLANTKIEKLTRLTKYYRLQNMILF
jgi:hypothetical protein